MSITANRPIEGMRASLDRASRWWVGELRAAWADAAHHVREWRGNGITIVTGEREWLVRRGQRPLGTIDRAALGAGRLRTLVDQTDRRAAVTIEIPPERVLSKTITLPAGAQGRLDRVLGFEIGRHFPFAAERVFFGYRVIGGPAAGGTPGPAPLAVEIAAVPREIVFAIADELAAGGLRASAFALLPAPNATPLRLAAEPLLPVAAAAPPDRRWLVAIGLLALAAVISWPLAQQVRLSAIEREIAALKPAAEAALQVRSRRDRTTEQEAAIARLRGGRLPLVAVLDLLSREVPDGAWLLSLSVIGRDMVLDGLAPSAATIALALQRNPNFSDISFRSPIARDAATGLEHFQLGVVLTEPKR